MTNKLKNFNVAWQEYCDKSQLTNNSELDISLKNFAWEIYISALNEIDVESMNNIPYKISTNLLYESNMILFSLKNVIGDYQYRVYHQF